MARGALTEIVLEDAHHGGSGHRRRGHRGGGDPCSSEKRRIIHPAGFSAVAEGSAPRLAPRCFAGRRSRARAGPAATGESGAAARGQPDATAETPGARAMSVCYRSSVHMLRDPVRSMLTTSYPFNANNLYLSGQCVLVCDRPSPIYDAM